MANSTNERLFQRVSHSFERQSFLKTIGATLEQVKNGSVTVSCERAENLTQQQGFLHGGVITSLADVACGYAALTTAPEGYEVLSVECKINFMRPAIGRKFTAEGRVVKAGKTLAVTEAMVTDEENAAVAVMVATMFLAEKET